MTKNRILILLLIVLSNVTYSQTQYEKGYYINNNGQKSEGLIRNKNWSDNPQRFHFKSPDSDQSDLLTIDSVSEFGIYGKLRFIRKEVNIDRSGELFRDLDYKREPVFSEETLFLRILVDGKHCLYEYKYHNLLRFFFESDSFPITQLVYKKFLVDKLSVGTNRDYRKQLWKYKNCDLVSMKELTELKYFRDELIGIVLRFNVCDGAEPVNLAEKVPYKKFGFSAKAGSGFSSYEITGLTSITYNIEFEHKPCFQAGIEAEYILPVHKHKLGLTAEIAYFNYKAEGYNQTLQASVDYKSIELPLGVRYHFYPGGKSDVYVSAFYIVNQPLKLDIKYSIALESKMKSSSNIGFGIGFKYNRKFLVEFRAMRPRFMPGEIGTFWYSEYRSFSFLIGYTIF